MTTGQTTGYGAAPAWPAPPQAAASPRRPGWVTTAAVLMLVVGTLSALIGVVLLVMALAFGPAWTELMSGQPGMETVSPEAVTGMMTAFFLIMAVISLAWAAGHVAAGVGVLAGRGWARVTGIVLSVMGVLFSLLVIALTLGSFGMTEEMMQDPQFRDLYGPGYTPDVMGSLLLSLVFIVPWLIGYVIVLVVLIRNGAFFSRPAAAVSQPIG